MILKTHTSELIVRWLFGVSALSMIAAATTSDAFVEWLSGVSLASCAVLFLFDDDDIKTVNFVALPLTVNLALLAVHPWVAGKVLALLMVVALTFVLTSGWVRLSTAPKIIKSP